MRYVKPLIRLFLDDGPHTIVLVLDDPREWYLGYLLAMDMVERMMEGEK